MMFGTTVFKCSECDKVFSAPDIEYGATSLSTPMPCQRCGSIRTYPLSSILSKGSYKKIWEEMEKENKEKL